MVRRGWVVEREVHKLLIESFGEFNVIPTKWSGLGFDFLVFKGVCHKDLGDFSHLLKVVEVKSTIGKYPHWCRGQKKRIKLFCSFHNVPCEVWVKYVNGVGRKPEWEVSTLV